MHQVLHTDMSKCFTQVHSVLLEFTAVALHDLILPICQNLELVEMLGSILKYAQVPYVVCSFIEDESARNDQFTQCHVTKTQAD